MADIAMLVQHAEFDLLILNFGDLHHHIISNSVNKPWFMEWLHLQ